MWKASDRTYLLKKEMIDFTVVLIFLLLALIVFKFSLKLFT